MSIRSMLRAWTRWSGGAPQPPRSKGGGRFPRTDHGQPPELPVVLQKLAAQARVGGDVEAALTHYQSALQGLSAGGGTKNRAAALDAAQEELEQLKLPSALGGSLAILQELLAGCGDVVFRGVLIGGRRPGLVLFVNGMVKMEQLERSVIQPLNQWRDPESIPGTAAALQAWLESVAVATGQTGMLRTVGDLLEAVFSGHVALLMDGVPEAVKLSIPGWEQRSIDEPVSEPVIRGPREGFTETLQTNATLLRRRIRTPQLKLEQIVLGRRTSTTVAVMYLKDVASPTVVAEAKARLERIDVDGILDTGYIEEFIEDQPMSPFPQVLATERPDAVAAGLLEGQVAILADNSPFALLAPVTMWSFMQAAEDYYQRFWMVSALRWLRYLLLLVALTAPSIYIAVVTFHQEMLPTPLLLTIAATREGIPFPAVMEAFLMEIFFEALREAGVRLPRPVGQAVSIVGALVIGQAAVQAGLVSAPKVIIVAATGIASFTIPRFSFGLAVRMLRFPLMVLAGTLGLYGILAGMLAILIHLCALRSFGTPYLQPASPFTWTALKDVVVRAPQWLLGRRPPGWDPLDPQRQAPLLKPGPGGGSK